MLEKGFKRAEIAIQAPPPRPQSVPAPPPPAGYEKVIPLKTVTGELLANIYGGVHSMRIVPAEDKEFNINTPPFIAFFVGRVLAKMQEKDREAAASGEISPDKIFSYQISQEGDIIKEILIQHITTDRSRELKSTIRWTLEKMYEKTMKSGS